MAGAGLARLNTLPTPKDLPWEQPKQAFERRYPALLSDRSPFMDDWRKIAETFRPMRGRFLLTDRNQPRSHNQVLRNETLTASRTLQNGMQAGISSPARPWFKLSLPDKDMAEAGGIKRWLQFSTRLMGEVFSRSNLYDQLHTVWGDLGDMGTAAVIVDEDYEDVIRLTVSPAGEYCLALDARNRTNTMYRTFQMSVLQMVQKFPWDRLSRRVRDAWDAGRYDMAVEVVHVLEPNANQIKGARGPMGSPFIDVYYERGCSEEHVLTATSRELTFMGPRWDVMDGDTYGTGCGKIALGDGRGLQRLEMRAAQLVDKMAAPPLQGSTATKNGAVSHLPGGMTYTDQAAAGQRGAILPLYEINPSGLTATEQRGQAASMRVQTAYYADLFLMLAQTDRREITAREVDERHEEKLLQLGPVLERAHNELLGPIIDATFKIMLKGGILPAPPKELEGQMLKVEFTSILAQAQRAVGLGAMERTLGLLGNLSGAYPTALDKLNPDQFFDEYAEGAGVPASIIRTDDEVASIREDRAQQQQAQTAMAAASQGADTAKVLSEARVSPDSLLSQLTGQA